MKTILFLLALITQSFLFGQSFVNPSFEEWGNVTYCDSNSAPNNWSDYSNGALGMDEVNFNFCGTTIPMNASLGMVYARSSSVSTTTGEGMFQNVSGFTIGEQYQISFDYAGTNIYGGTNSSQWHLFIDDVEVDVSPIFLSSEANWLPHSYTFTASSTTHKIGFRAYTVDNSSTGNAAIDNLNLSSTAGIQENFKEGKDVVYITDLMGKVTRIQNNKTLILHYSDGSTKRIFIVE